MGVAEFWILFGALWQTNPPHSNDYLILQRMAHLGLVPPQPIEFDELPAQSRDALTKAVSIGQKRIDYFWLKAGNIRNGWCFDHYPLGKWGTAYLVRATVAWWAIGANLPEDALYPIGVVDDTGQPLNSANNYVLHFPKDELPPVNSFWSLTMYDSEMFRVVNPIDRHAIGDRGELEFNEDGSLTLYIQRE